MTAPAPAPAPSKGYGSAEDYAKVFKGSAEGAGSATAGASSGAIHARQAREAKRRTLAKFMNDAIKRNQQLYHSGQEHGDEMSDYQSQSLQNIARGFINSMQGKQG